jgi:hypothetical protein
MTTKFDILRALVASHKDTSGSQGFTLSLDLCREVVRMDQIKTANLHEKELLIREQAADIAMLHALVKVSA